VGESRVYTPGIPIAIKGYIIESNMDLGKAATFAAYNSNTNQLKVFG